MSYCQTRSYYALFSDSKNSMKVSPEDYLLLSCFARSLNAILTEVHHRFGVTLSVAFTRSLFCHYKLNLYYETTLGKD